MTAPQLPQGTIVSGKYRLNGLMGYGGSSATYQAQSSEGYFALKVLSPQIAQRGDIVQAIQQFQAGTNALPRDLAVPVVDAGFDQALGVPYSVTELVRTPTLAQLVAQRPLSIEELTLLLHGLGRVIDAAHRNQMAHHALKPSNIFVGTPHSDVRVMDFGASLVRSVIPTSEGYEGSAPWMAPEQAQPTAQAGTPADIFSSALIAFYVLTGRSYWLSCQGPRPDVAAWQREVTAPPVPFSVRGREVGFPLNPVLDAVFARALATNPAERYRSVGELAGMLRIALQPQAQGEDQTIAFPAAPAAAPYPATPAPGAYPPSPAPAPYAPAPAAHAPAPAAAHVHAGQMTQVALPPTALPNRRRPVIWFVIAAGALLGGGAIAATIYVAKSSAATPSPVTVAADVPGAAPDADVTAAATTPIPPPAASTDPSASASASASAEAAADKAPSEVKVTITCEPACDSVSVDSKAVKDPSEPLSLLPGKYKITASKAGYLARTETITVEDDKPIEKTFTLTKPVVRTTAPTPKAKPCGKFLKRCD